MRVCNVIQRYPPAVGGSETWAGEVCAKISDRGHEVEVLTLDVLDEDEFWREKNTGKKTSAGPAVYEGGVLVRRYHRSLPIHWVHHTLYKALDEKFGIYFYGPHSVQMYVDMGRRIAQADLVHAHTIPYPHNFFSFLWSKLLGKRLVITPHFHPGHPHYERKIFYRLMAGCDAVIAVSDYEKKELARRGVPKEKIYVAGNGINPASYEPSGLDAFREEFYQKFCLTADTKLVAFVGRRMEYKGLADLVDAVDSVNRHTPTRLLLIGPSTPWYDSFYASLPKRKRELVINAGVVPQKDKVNLLHLSGLLALPSKFEAFGIVFLEAWACGKPVVGSDQGAIPSVIGQDGLTARFGDSRDLAEKIRKLLDDAELAGRMGESGRRKVMEKYTWQRIADQVLAVYEKVLNP